jgi:MFS family permease
VQVLLCQSLPAVAKFKLSTKWGLVIIGQVLSVLTSLVSVFWPTFVMITTSRALHGIGESLYMIYALILLVELTPRKHLALGIASLTAGRVWA